MVRYRTAVGKRTFKGRIHIYVDLCGEKGINNNDNYVFGYFQNIKPLIAYLRATMLDIRAKLSSNPKLEGGEGIADDPIVYKLSALNDEIVRISKPLKPKKNLEKVVQEEKPKQEESEDYGEGLMDLFKEEGKNGA